MLAKNDLSNQNADLESIQIALDQMSQTIEVLGNVVQRLQIQLTQYQQQSLSAPSFKQEQLAS